MPEINKKDPAKQSGREDTEYYKASKIIFPVTSLTTKTSLIRLDTMLKLSLPGFIVRSFRMHPEFKTQQSVSK